MGIVNVTPDSFYQGSRNQSITESLRSVEKMLTDGASCIDVGGFSTRPFSQEVSIEEEKNRVIPVISEISKNFPDTLLSVDTFRLEIAQEAIRQGAHIVNDVSGGTNEALHLLCAENKVPYVLMHTKGKPTNDMTDTSYEHLVADIYSFLTKKMVNLQQKGLNDVIIDLGFGFAKTMEQNYELLSHLDFFTSLDKPLMVGISRKSMLTKLLQLESEDALNGTTVLNTIALMKGADILRVHDVKEAVQVCKIMRQIKKNSPNSI